MQLMRLSSAGLVLAASVDAFTIKEICKATLGKDVTMAKPEYPLYKITYDPKYNTKPKNGEDLQPIFNTPQYKSEFQRLTYAVKQLTSYRTPSQWQKEPPLVFQEGLNQVDQLRDVLRSRLPIIIGRMLGYSCNLLLKLEMDFEEKFDDMSFLLGELHRPLRKTKRRSEDVIQLAAQLEKLRREGQKRIEFAYELRVAQPDKDAQRTKLMMENIVWDRAEAVGNIAITKEKLERLNKEISFPKKVKEEKRRLKKLEEKKNPRAKGCFDFASEKIGWKKCNDEEDIEVSPEELTHQYNQAIYEAELYKLEKELAEAKLTLLLPPTNEYLHHILERSEHNLARAVDLFGSGIHADIDQIIRLQGKIEQTQETVDELKFAAESRARRARDLWLQSHYQFTNNNHNNDNSPASRDIEDILDEVDDSMPPLPPHSDTNLVMFPETIDEVDAEREETGPKKTLPGTSSPPNQDVDRMRWDELGNIKSDISVKEREIKRRRNPITPGIMDRNID